MKKKSRNQSQLPIYFFRLTLLLIGCGAIFGILYALSTYFTVKEVRCQLLTINQACPTELSESLRVLHHLPMFFTDYANPLANTALMSQPMSLVQIRKIFPRTLVLTFQLESPAYVLVTQNSQAVVSQTGKIFVQELVAVPALVVETTSNLDNGQGRVDASIHHTILNIIATSQTLGLPLTRITWVDKSTIQLSMENRAESFVLDSERPTLALHRLALILNSSEYREMTEPKAELDLRFTMPVLRTQP